MALPLFDAVVGPVGGVGASAVDKSSSCCFCKVLFHILMKDLNATNKFPK